MYPDTSKPIRNNQELMRGKSKTLQQLDLTISCITETVENLFHKESDESLHWLRFSDNPEDPTITDDCLGQTDEIMTGLKLVPDTGKSTQLLEAVQKYLEMVQTKLRCKQISPALELRLKSQLDVISAELAALESRAEESDAELAEWFGVEQEIRLDDSLARKIPTTTGMSYYPPLGGTTEDEPDADDEILDEMDQRDMGIDTGVQTKFSDSLHEISLNQNRSLLSMIQSLPLRAMFRKTLDANGEWSGFPMLAQRLENIREYAGPMMFSNIGAILGEFTGDDSFTFISSLESAVENPPDDPGLYYEKVFGVGNAASSRIHLKSEEDHRNLATLALIGHFSQTALWLLVDRAVQMFPKDQRQGNTFINYMVATYKDDSNLLKILRYCREQQHQRGKLESLMDELYGGGMDWEKNDAGAVFSLVDYDSLGDAIGSATKLLTLLYYWDVANDARARMYSVDPDFDEEVDEALNYRLDDGFAKWMSYAGLAIANNQCILTGKPHTSLSRDFLDEIVKDLITISAETNYNLFKLTVNVKSAYCRTGSLDLNYGLQSLLNNLGTDWKRIQGYMDTLTTAKILKPETVAGIETFIDAIGDQIAESAITAPDFWTEVAPRKVETRQFRETTLVAPVRSVQRQEAPQGENKYQTVTTDSTQLSPTFNEDKGEEPMYKMLTTQVMADILGRCKTVVRCPEWETYLSDKISNPGPVLDLVKRLIAARPELMPVLPDTLANRLEEINRLAEMIVIDPVTGEEQWPGFGSDGNPYQDLPGTDMPAGSLLGASLIAVNAPTVWFDRFKRVYTSLGKLVSHKRPLDPTQTEHMAGYLKRLFAHQDAAIASLLEMVFSVRMFGFRPLVVTLGVNTYVAAGWDRHLHDGVRYDSEPLINPNWILDAIQTGFPARLAQEWLTLFPVSHEGFDSQYSPVVWEHMTRLWAHVNQQMTRFAKLEHRVDRLTGQVTLLSDTVKQMLGSLVEYTSETQDIQYEADTTTAEAESEVSKVVTPVAETDTAEKEDFIEEYEMMLKEQQELRAGNTPDLLWYETTATGSVELNTIGDTNTPDEVANQPVIFADLPTGGSDSVTPDDEEFLELHLEEIDLAEEWGGSANKDQEDAPANEAEPEDDDDDITIEIEPAEDAEIADDVAEEHGESVEGSSETDVPIGGMGTDTSEAEDRMLDALRKMGQVSPNVIGGQGKVVRFEEYRRMPGTTTVCITDDDSRPEVAVWMK